MKTLFKLALVGILFWFLFRNGLISKEATLRAFSHHRLLGLGALCLSVTSLIGGIRWQWLLRAQGIELPLITTLKLSYIGSFFNVALPGAVSGDFVKAFYVAQLSSGQRARAFGSILFDRVVGLSALVLVSTGALILDIDVLRGTALISAIQTMMIIASVSVILFYGYLFLMRESYDPVLVILRSLGIKVPKLAGLERIYLGIRHYHSHRKTVVAALLASVVIQVLVAFGCIQLLGALEVTGVAHLPVFVVVPLGLLVTAVPVAPAGVGTGHFAFGHLFSLLGTQRGADVFSLYALVQFLVGGVGGLIYLRYKSHAPSVVPE